MNSLIVLVAFASFFFYCEFFTRLLYVPASPLFHIFRFYSSPLFYDSLPSVISLARRRGKKITNIFFRIANVKGYPNMLTGCVFSQGTRRYFRRILANVKRSSICAKRIPMQFRGPAPKGCHARGLNLCLFSGRNLSVKVPVSVGNKMYRPLQIIPLL